MEKKLAKLLFFMTAFLGGGLLLKTYKFDNQSQQIIDVFSQAG